MPSGPGDYTKFVVQRPGSDLLTIPVHCPGEDCARIEYQNAHGDYLAKGHQQPVRFRCEAHGFYKGYAARDGEGYVVRLRKLMTYLSEYEWEQSFPPLA